MQPINSALDTAARSVNRAPYAKVVIDDPRIRNWIQDDSNQTNQGQFDARLTNNGKVIKAVNRNSDNHLMIGLATLGAGQVFTYVDTGNVCGANRGVAIFNDPTDSTSPNRIDVFFFDAGTTTPAIKRISSTDNGTTFGAAVTIVTLETQHIVGTVFWHQLSCAGWAGNGGTYNPSIFYLSYTASLGGHLVFWDGSANQQCTLDTLQIPTTDTQSYEATPSTLGSFQLNSADFVCAINLTSPRNLPESGIYLIWYRNGIWSTPYPVFTYQNVLVGNAQFTLGFPYLTKIGSNYWLFATEYWTVPGLSNITTTKQNVFRVGYVSPDLTYWSDRIYLMGYTTDVTTSGLATIFRFKAAASYDTVFSTLMFRQSVMLQSGANTYMVGYSGDYFHTQTTSAISSTPADYANNQVDITADVEQFSIDLPNGPGGQGNLTLINHNQQYNNSSIIRRGSRIVIQAGYHTTVGTDANDLMTIFTGRLDIVDLDLEIALNVITLTFRDEAMKKLQTWVADTWWEYSSGRQINIPIFQDYGSTIAIQGTWLLNGGFLHAQRLPNNNLFRPKVTMIAANTGRIEDGIYDVRMKFENLKTGAWGGPLFRLQNNINWYGVVHNYPDPNVWSLIKTDGATIVRVVTKTTITNAIPAVGEIWWCRIVVYHNILYVFARKNTNPKWIKIFSIKTQGTIKTRTGYWGFVSLGGTQRFLQVNNLASAIGAFRVHNGQWFASRFTMPTGMGGTPHLTGVGMELSIKGSPGGTIQYTIFKDNGGGNSPVGTQLVTAVTIFTSILQDQAMSSINLGPLNLEPGKHYWIGFKPNLNVDNGGNNIGVFFNTSGIETNSCLSTDGGSSWTVENSCNGIFTANISLGAPACAFGGYDLYTQEEPQTMDTITRQIAAKAGVMSVKPNYFINENFSGTLANWNTGNEKGTWAISSGQLQGTNPASTYGFLYANIGTIVDMVLTCDMTISGAGGRAGFIFNQQNNASMATAANVSCFVVEFDAAANVVNIYACVGGEPNQSTNLIFQGAPIFDIVSGKQYHVKIQHSGKFIVVYLNSAIVAAVNTDTVDSTNVTNTTKYLQGFGYVGVMGFGDSGVGGSCLFDNFQIAELTQVKDYYVIEENRTGESAIADVHKFDRVKTYGDFDGGLIYSTFDQIGASQVTFSDKFIIKTKKTSEDRDIVSHLRPYGDYEADRFSGALLDSDGHRFKSYEYTDARTDAEAYVQGAWPMRYSKEQADIYTLDGPAYPALQREDRVTIQNGFDGTNTDYLVDSIKFSFKKNPIEFDMELLCRLFIATSGEAGAV